MLFLKSEYSKSTIFAIGCVINQSTLRKMKSYIIAVLKFV